MPQANAAEDVSSSTPKPGSEEADQASAIADLLIGDDEKDDESESDDSKASADEDNKDVDTDESDESTEDADELEVEDEDDDEDVSWESVLGVSEGKLNFDEDGNLAGVNVKVDGKTSTVSMTDLIAGFQNNKMFTQKSQTLAKEREVFETERSEVEQAYKGKIEQVIGLQNYMEKALVSEFEAVDWPTLRVENPAEYAATQQDFQRRAQELENIKQMTTQVNKEQQDAIDQRNEGIRKEYLKQQYGKMIENNPAWADEQTYNADMTRLKSFCSNQYGFTQEDFAMVKDARLVELIKDAEKFHSGAKLASKKLKKPVPKFQKSGGKTKSKKVSKLQNLTKAAKSALGEERRNLQAEAVAELLTGGQ